ncbi:MAG: tetratricopeptide repeat protein [Rhodospirillales bacterium]
MAAESPSPSADATPASLLSAAVAQHGRGRLDEAEALYRRVLLAVPNEANALNLLGVIRIQRGDPAGAVALIEQAIAAAPRFPQAHHNIGWALQSLGRFADAQAHYRAALALDDSLAESHNNLGNVLLNLGRQAEARAAFERAIGLRPDYAEALSNLGDLLRQLGEGEAAIAMLRRSLAVNPGSAAAENNLGIALLAADRLEEAEAAFRRASALNPGSAVAWNGLGNALDLRNRPTEAVAAFRRALDLQPRYASAMTNLGSAYRTLADYGRGIELQQQALAIEPDNPTIHANLGNLYADIGAWDDAIRCYERVLAIGPADSEAGLGGLCVAYAEKKDFESCLRHARRLYERDPESDFALATIVNALANSADWSDSRSTRQLMERVDRALADGRPMPVAPFTYLHMEADPARHLRAAQITARDLEETVADVRRPSSSPSRGRDGERLRIGFVSYDFRNHPAAHLIGNSFALYDRTRFEIFAYGYGRDGGDDYRKRIVASVDRFVDITNDSFEASAQRICDDGIDILVDMMGWTRNSRLALFALRPAPIQVSWLGFPGTTGATFIDYLIADPVVVPPEAEKFFTERIARVPHFYMINDRTFERDLPTVTRADVGLPDDGFVFASFNNIDKLDADTFASWLRILSRVPHGILWNMGGAAVERNLKASAAAAGIDPARILMAPKVPKRDHIARLALADLALDTRIYNGHTTTCDLLWAGVPVLTMRGSHFPGRVSASALTVLGLPELITDGPAAYEAAALRLATDRPALQSLRARIAATRETSPLVDSARWVRNAERLFDTMWLRHRAGATPATFDITDP